MGEVGDDRKEWRGVGGTSVGGVEKQEGVLGVWEVWWEPFGAGGKRREGGLECAVCLFFFYLTPEC